MTAFELAGGSVVGRDHRVVPKNNQDAWYILTRGDVTVAAVCDGCGSGAHSEVGAAIGARVICQATINALQDDPSYLWEYVEKDLLGVLHNLAREMGSNYRKTVEDYFLFTIVGCLLTPRTITFFGLGDGTIVIDGGRSTAGGPYPDNAPPYLAYRLLNERRTRTDRTPIGFFPDELHLDAFASYDPSSVGSFLIGCDGAGSPGLQDVCDSDRTLPGTETPVGPISQFWEDDRFFQNPVALSRRLKLIARDWPPHDPEHGLLGDDTTIVVGRRVE